MRDGFDDFVRSRSTGLLRIAYLLTGDRHSAEDLVQEVLEQMYVKWRRIHTLDCSEGNVESSVSRGLTRLRAALDPVTTTTERGQA
ncbi:sigma factor [Actinoplanes sp. NPDC004185]